MRLIQLRFTLSKPSDASVSTLADGLFDALVDRARYRGGGERETYEGLVQEASRSASARHLTARPNIRIESYLISLRGRISDSLGIARHMNSSNKGTVNAVSPWDGLYTIPFLIS